jgi:hypothetical protein
MVSSQEVMIEESLSDLSENKLLAHKLTLKVISDNEIRVIETKIS